MNKLAHKHIKNVLKKHNNHTLTVRKQRYKVPEIIYILISNKENSDNLWLDVKILTELYTTSNMTNTEKSNCFLFFSIYKSCPKHDLKHLISDDNLLGFTNLSFNYNLVKVPNYIYFTIKKIRYNFGVIDFMFKIYERLHADLHKSNICLSKNKFELVFVERLIYSVYFSNNNV